MGPALFYVAVGLVGLAGVLATKETWGPKQRAEVDAQIRGEATEACRRSGHGLTAVYHQSVTDGEGSEV
jgi:hypothetical protein